MTYVSFQIFFYRSLVCFFGLYWLFNIYKISIIFYSRTKCIYTSNAKYSLWLIHTKTIKNDEMMWWKSTIFDDLHFLSRLLINFLSIFRFLLLCKPPIFFLFFLGLDTRTDFNSWRTIPRYGGSRTWRERRSQPWWRKKINKVLYHWNMWKYRNKYESIGYK